MDPILDILKVHKLRITDNRVSLLKIFSNSETALSAQDIENLMPEADRVTLYRTLKSFQEKGIIHKAIDGTDTPRYAMCVADCSEHSHHDEHVHFRCTVCQHTFCLNDIFVPQVDAPPGFRVSGTHMVVEGVCANC